MRLPQGKTLITASDLSIKLGERVLVSGPSGAGKSTLFRAFAGIWPFGSGTITVPKNARVMILPQRPYFPIAPLAAAVAYPAEPGSFDAGKVAELITAVGLPALAARIEEEAHWNRMLSLGEQQRLGIARALLYAPDYLLSRRGDCIARRAGRGRALPVAGSQASQHHHRIDRSPRQHLRRSTNAGWRSTAKVITTPCGRRISRRSHKRKRTAGEKRRGGDRLWPPPLRDRRLTRLLLQAAEREVSRQLGNEGCAAPAGGGSTIDRHRAAHAPSGWIAGEGVTVTLAQVRVVVAQIEREHFPGQPTRRSMYCSRHTECRWDCLPVPDAAKGYRFAAVERVTGAEPLMAEFT